MPDAKRTPLYLTGEQLNSLHYILGQEISRKQRYKVEPDSTVELRKTVYEALQRSGFLEEQRQRISENVQKYLATPAGQRWREQYERGRRNGRF